ncbi:MAG TPA: sugar transferase [Gemmatimonadaceae bacterium]|nr:sugar transferase [Gemmatimonadaceae bacterium]
MTSSAQRLAVPPEASPVTHAAVTSAAKRGIDIAIAVAAFCVALPLILVVVAAIKLSSRGPVLFRQRRVGLNGEQFTMLKFRTMRADAQDDRHRAYVVSMLRGREVVTDPQTPGVFKLTADDRVTSVGAFLRKTSLDELPQFLNVFRGEMSVVGPRPALAYEVDEYAPWQHRRFAVRPGITGWWQVSGRNRMTYVEMCRCDVDYVNAWSLALDLRIIIRTPWVMISNSGRAA